MKGEIYKNRKDNRLYLVMRTISNIEKTRIFVEFYRLKVCYQKVPCINHGHYFPKRQNKNISYVEPIEEFEKNFVRAEDIDLIPLPSE